MESLPKPCMKSVVYDFGQLFSSIVGKRWNWMVYSAFNTATFPAKNIKYQLIGILTQCHCWSHLNASKIPSHVHYEQIIFASLFLLLTSGMHIWNSVWKLFEISCSNFRIQWVTPVIWNNNVHFSEIYTKYPNTIVATKCQSEFGKKAFVMVTKRLWFTVRPLHSAVIVE